MVSVGLSINSRVYSGRFYRPGFSLIEMVVSLAVMSILMVAMGSVIMLATNAGPKSASAYSATISQVHDVDRLLDELAYADSFSILGLNEISFTVPDRDGNLIPETIRYRWSGVVGSPLYRFENGGGAQVVFDAVKMFDLEYIYDKVTEVGVPVETESAEQLLTSYSAGGAFETGVTSADWIGMSILPSLPVGADSWAVTRAFVALRPVGNFTGELRAQLQLTTSTGTPSGIIIDEQPLFESTMVDAYTWHEFKFTQARGLSPTERLCLVLQRVSGGTAAAALYNNGFAYNKKHWLVYTNDSGATWYNYTDLRLMYYVYGTVTTVTTPTVTRTFLRRVGVKLIADETNPQAADVAVRIINAPEVVP